MTERGTPVLNLFGGPGAGKSVAAHGLMHKLKCMGVAAEFAAEYAKDLVAEGRFDRLRDQMGIFREQRRRVARWIGKADLVVNEAPLLNSLVYAPDGFRDSDADRVRRAWSGFRNVNFLVVRCDRFGYQRSGRCQDEAGAAEIDVKVAFVLRTERIDYTAVRSADAVECIVSALRERSVI